MTHTRHEIAKYRLGMDGYWELQDLSFFGRKYGQAYALLYALQFCPGPEVPDHPIPRAFRKFSGLGGWSTVGFYDTLQKSVPKEYQPRVVAIQYASPGFIELAALYPVVWLIRRIVNEICGGIKDVHDVYHACRKGAMERKLLSIDVRKKELDLAPSEREFADRSAERLSEAMGLTPLNDELKRLTDNPVARMKIVLSLYRRIHALAELQDSKGPSLDFRGDIHRNGSNGRD